MGSLLKRRMVLIPLAVLLLGGAGGGAFLFLGASGGGEDGAEAPTPEPTAVHVEGRLGPHITLEDRVFTLRGPMDQLRYAKVRIVLEFETDDPSWFELSGEELDQRLAEFGAELPRALIEDAVVTAVSGRSAEEVATAEGKDALRAEIRAAVAELVPEPSVRRVLFTSFVTQ